MTAIQPITQQYVPADVVSVISSLQWHLEKRQAEKDIPAWPCAIAGQEFEGPDAITTFCCQQWAAGDRQAVYAIKSAMTTLLTQIKPTLSAKRTPHRSRRKGELHESGL